MSPAVAPPSVNGRPLSDASRDSSSGRVGGSAAATRGSEQGPPERVVASAWDWWLTGLPCMLLVLAYGGTASLLCGSIGTLLWYMLDLSGPDFAGAALAVWCVSISLYDCAPVALTISNIIDTHSHLI